jgi:hypothetical protein
MVTTFLQCYAGFFFWRRHILFYSTHTAYSKETRIRHQHQIPGLQSSMSEKILCGLQYKNKEQIRLPLRSVWRWFLGPRMGRTYCLSVQWVPLDKSGSKQSMSGPTCRHPCLCLRPNVSEQCWMERSAYKGCKKRGRWRKGLAHLKSTLIVSLFDKRISQSSLVRVQTKIMY